MKTAYREIMHAHARDLTKTSNFKDALLLWRHLHGRKLVSQSLYLDAARCFSASGQNDDAVRVLAEALEAFGPTADADFLEQAGDIALALKTAEADKLAESAYARASRKMMNTISNPKEKP